MELEVAEKARKEKEAADLMAQQERDALELKIIDQRVHAQAAEEKSQRDRDAAQMKA